MKIDLSIVIPAYNEEKRIEDTLRDYCSFLKKQKFRTEVIVVIDGFDGTSKIVKQYSKKYDGMVRYLEFSRRLGKGGAIMAGFTSAKGRLVGFVDADGSTKPCDIIRLAKFTEKNGDCDGTIGSRWVKGAVFSKKPSVFRIFLSRGLNVLVRGFLGLDFRDTQCGAKVFKREVIRECLPNLDVTGFSFDIYLTYLAMKKGYRIKEVPLRWEYSDGSKIEISDILEMFFDICKLRIKSSELIHFAS